MEIKDVYIRAFRSFRKPVHWAWPATYGLYLVCGDNRVDPQLGGNAAGKSSLFEAVVWCLYGKTARGLRGPDVAPWDLGEAEVTVTYTRLGQQYEVRRTVGPNALMLNGTVVEQDAVTKALGVNYECFLFSAVMGQFNRYFFDLGATEKLNLFSFVLDLDAWVDRSGRAKLDQDFSEAAVAKGEAVMAGLAGRQGEIAVQLAGLEQATQEWEDEKRAGLAELDAAVGELATKAATLAQRGVRVAGRLSLAQSEVEALKEAGAARGEAARKAQAEGDRLRNRISAVSHDIKQVHSESRDVEQAAPFCRVCHQDVTKAHVRATLKSLRVKARNLRNRKRELAAELAAWRLGDQKRVQRLARLGESLRGAEENEVRLERLVREHQWAVEENEKRQREIVAEREELESEVNPYGGQYDRAIENLHEVAAAQRQRGDELLALRERASQSRYWAKGFKELRLWLVEEVLRELELETNNALTAIGLDGWEVKYEIERETKAGGVAKGFHVFVLPPGSGAPVKWECYSGGETQRLRVAGALGVANLISRRRGVELAWEVWDEPTAHINASGVDDLLQFFRDRARLEEKQVWFIDHHVLDAGCFDGAFRVVKDAAGSRLEAGV